MNDYDSDSSQGSASGTATTVLLGYASREPTGDEVSHLGGQPTWLDPSSPPSASLASCKSCSALMPLLLQLNGALPERFPGHERRLYIWGCPRKRCRRKEGSVRAVRGVRVAGGRDAAVEEGAGEEKMEMDKAKAKEKVDIGGQLFGAGGGLFGASASSSSGNPFSKGAPSSSPNPFSTTQPQTTPDTTTLSESFASKARISTPTPPQPTASPTPWPSDPSALPNPYPHLHLDAEYEYLYPSSPPKPTSAHYAALMDTSTSTSADSKDMYESTHDRAFQAFADRLAENPEQVLRYEFAGTPLLSSRSDGAGNALSGVDKGGTLARVPRCARCGAGRVFEVQLTPQAIAELEGDAVDEGMEWCTVVVGVCERDCGGGEGVVEYCEEWCGVQWEEQVARTR